MSEQQQRNYKDTLNLPQTRFDMRAGLLKKEPAIQDRWRQQRLYQRMLEARESGKVFTLHDGPPYANGNIHMGHALNKVLKDLVLRTRSMAGCYTPFIPGWDCHGLPIEAKVTEELGPQVRTMEPMEIRRRCREYAARFVDLQAEQFQRLGVLGDFDAPYITMDPSYEAAVLEVFARLAEQGAVYKQLKPVHWSIENRTALADAELEYYERSDPSVFVALRLAGNAAEQIPHESGDRVQLLIWTTTPWTLPANLAVAVHPDYEYACLHFETTDGAATYVIAAGRVDAVVAAIQAARPGWLEATKVCGKIWGRDLVKLGTTYWHPIHEQQFCPVVPANYVTLEDGTGLVHTAPGHGMEDYGTGLKHGLDIYCPVQADGTFDETVPPWLAGRSVWDANGLIVDHLRDAGSLVLSQQVVHSYPHDWRSKTPTILRATEQWFVAVDEPLRSSNQSLRQMAMELCRLAPTEGGVGFIPSWGRTRMLGMLESRPDWCISRQRTWGLPIPAFYAPTGEALLTPRSVRAVAAVIEREGSDAWFTRTPRELLAGYDPTRDPDLENGQQFALDELVKGQDIFDVWFDAGSSWFAVAMNRGLVDQIPVDLYLEGSDQHRGWFQLSLLPALGTEGFAPFRTVLTHGFVVDPDGRKMSKSLGNTTDVLEQLEKRGADVLRLWIAQQNYHDDVRCGEELIEQSEDAYRKIRNTLRFCMGVCDDFDPARDAVEPPDHSIDRWMQMELTVLIRDVRTAFDNYEFHRATRLIYEFCTIEASSIYLSAVKDRLYCESPGAIRRRATQTVVHDMLMTLVKLLAPIIPHTAEEAWEAIPNRPADEPDTVHLALLPQFDPAILDLATNMRPTNRDWGTVESGSALETGPAWIWDRLLELRDYGLAKLEALRKGGVKNPLDAEAVFYVRSGADATAALLDSHLRELEDMLGVGYARIERTDDLPDQTVVDVEIFDTRDKYARCARSWKRRPDVGRMADYPELSARDAAVVRELDGR